MKRMPNKSVETKRPRASPFPARRQFSSASRLSRKKMGEILTLNHPRKGEEK